MIEGLLAELMIISDRLQKINDGIGSLNERYKRVEQGDLFRISVDNDHIQCDPAYIKSFLLDYLERYLRVKDNSRRELLERAESLVREYYEDTI